MRSALPPFPWRCSGPAPRLIQVALTLVSWHASDQPVVHLIPLSFLPTLAIWLMLSMPASVALVVVVVAVCLLACLLAFGPEANLGGVWGPELKMQNILVMVQAL